VWLAGQTGWPRSEWGTLCYVIYRESRGNPTATNSSSAAAGLLQFMPQWYLGQWSFAPFDPYDPRANLRHGRLLWGEQGWTPWAL
jgi:hypothetical protein